MYLRQILRRVSRNLTIRTLVFLTDRLQNSQMDCPCPPYRPLLMVPITPRPNACRQVGHFVPYRCFVALAEQDR